MIRPKKCVIKVSSMVRLAGWWVLLAFVAFALPLVLTNPAAAGSILTAPVGGEKLTAGGTYVIKWNYQGPVGLNNWIDLDYSPDSGVSWQPIKHTISLNETQYSWSVPNSPTTQGKIKISVWNQHMGGTFQDPQFNTVLGGSEVSGAFTVADMIMPILIPVSLKTPSNLTAKAVSASQIDLEWTDETDKETGYRIERKTGGGSYEVIATVAADTSAYSDSGLTKGTTYTYRVKAVGNGLLIKDSQYSDEVSAKTKVPIIISPSTPPAPTNLTAVAVSGTAVNLSWTDTAGNETGFKIERKTDGESYAEVGSVVANTTNFADNGLSPGSTYFYRIRACNGFVNSEYSNEASATTIQNSSTNTTTESDSDTNTTQADSSTSNTQSPQITICYYIGGSDYFVNGQIKTMDTVPIVRDGRTLLPIRYVAEPLGATVDWNSSEQKATVSMSGKTVEVWIDKNTARVNGSDITIDPANPKVVPIVVPPGRTMLPLRFIAENLGCLVEWNQSLQEVRVSYTKP